MSNMKTAGEDISQHVPLYLHTDGKLYEIDDLTDQTQVEAYYGFSREAVLSGKACPIWNDGNLTDEFDDIDDGVTYYLHTDGPKVRADLSAGDYSRQVGFGRGSNIQWQKGMVFTVEAADPSDPYPDYQTQTEGDARYAESAEDTDGHIAIPLMNGIGDGGTWTKAVSTSGLFSAARTANSGNHSFWADIPVPGRTTASRGVKATAVKVAYSVDTAAADDVRVELWEETLGADGSNPTAAVLGGNLDAHYAAAYDTAAERGANGAGTKNVTLTMTLPTPAYLAANKRYRLRFFVDGDAGGAANVILRSAHLLLSQRLLDNPA